MIKYNVEIIGLNQDIEEEVTLEINGIKLTCFASICPYVLNIGQKYPITFEMLDFELSEQINSEETSLKRTGNTYAHKLKGKLCGDAINSIIKVSDDALASDYAYLDGKYVSLNIEEKQTKMV